MKKNKDQLPTIDNRRARFDYAIEDTLECGIMLMGSEIKSVRAGEVQLSDGWVKVSTEPPTLELFNVNIGAYAPAALIAHKPKRARILLANKAEILKLAKKMDKGATIVPLKMYFKGAWAKVLIGLGHGKKAHDKRNTIATREAKRDIDRAMSRRAK
jgi:SsrA-binding protein